jgi:hypothetical protein
VQPDNTATPKRKKKRNLSPEGRARIAEAAKKRWAVAKKSRAKGGTGDGGYGITPKGGK